VATFAFAPDEVSISTSDAVAREVRVGLSGLPKTLAPWLFYDEAGSHLFEQITELPEYYLTRTERSIFAANADELLREAAASHGPHPLGKLTLIELGAGTATKTGILLAAAVRQQGGVVYQPVDVSETALAQASANILTNIPGVTIRCQVTDYTREALPLDRLPNTRTLALYIGSSIGNFGPEEARAILRKLRKQLKKTADAILLGVDLAPNCNKTVEQLIAAYDDAAGVTAAFNRNILARLNRELGADFNLDAFRHRAYFNPQDSRIEMHLVSTIAQTVTIDGKRITFAPGESIHTENSYKFTERALIELLRDSGYSAPQWFQGSDNHFAVALAYPA
jgi:dimethylhistidine N-methyltransferase